MSTARSAHRAEEARVQSAADLPKRKPDLKKLWPQIWALVAPRKGLLLAGMCLMAINRVAGPGVAIHVQAACWIRCCRRQTRIRRLLPRIIALVFSAMVCRRLHLSPSRNCYRRQGSV